jgi:hypothetical protein
MKALQIINIVEDKFQSENRQRKANKKVLTFIYTQLLQIFNKPAQLPLIKKQDIVHETLPGFGYRAIGV